MFVNLLSLQFKCHLIVNTFHPNRSEALPDFIDKILIIRVEEIILAWPSSLIVDHSTDDCAPLVDALESTIYANI